MYQDKSQDRVGVLQMNSEIQHAYLELLSAHCAVHQLRLHYSTDDLARCGRNDVLRKSAEAANALQEFYSQIEQRMFTLAPAPEALPQPTPELIAQGIQWMCECLRQNQERYAANARPLTRREAESLAPYFSDPVLNCVRIAELHGERVPTPDFVEQVRSMGFDNLPDLPHMDSLTFIDVIVFNEELNVRALFHGLVHAVQIRLLGLARYAELWVRGFAKGRVHFTVPLEVHAFSLAARYAAPSHLPFSVENEVLRWTAERRY
ncbi:MAG TPA: hypothetical protein VMX38_24070 [Verrucomicrobiae bacterium]|jgi:hypothetical protein|nr:hypothetical protein [Verrucomicrobiae bacterium]